MIPKPLSCAGCPFASLSKWYTPDLIVPDSTVTVLGQAPGEHEERGRKLIGRRYKEEIIEHVEPQPLIGASGNWLQREFWPLTELNYAKVSKANVLKCRPYGSNVLPSLANSKPANGIGINDLKAAIAHCTREHLKLPDSTKYVMAMGEIALYALTGEKLLNYRKDHIEDEIGEKRERKSTVTEWRGAALGKKGDSLLGLYDYFDPAGHSHILTLFPVVHLAALFESERYYHATLVDFWKFGSLVRGKWPKPLPEIKVDYLPRELPALLGFDTEYTAQNELEIWSLADAERNIYVNSPGCKLSYLSESTTFVTQNGQVDLPHLYTLLPRGFRTDLLTIEDCMLAWATIHAGEPTSLDYQLSICGTYNRHKHLRLAQDKVLKVLYAGLDADTTLNNSWKYIQRQFRRDQLLRDEYELRRRPLVPIIMRSQQKGVETDSARVELVKKLMDEKIARIDREARELTGRADFNIRSNGPTGQVAQFLYGVEVVEKKARAKARKKKASAQLELFQSLTGERDLELERRLLQRRET
jgi:uracil-DNA glycosylase